MRGSTRGAAGCLAALVAALTMATGASAGRDRDVVFEIQSSDIGESSSLVASTTHPHLVYTTNDSGDGPVVYVLDSRSGELVGTTTLAGVTAVDIEGLAGGSDGSLVVADIGDNDHQRDNVTVHKIDQPGRGTHTVEPESVTLTYPRGARDAEGVLYDAEIGTVFIVEKEYAGARVFATPRDVFDRSRAELTPVARAPGIATDATFVADQQWVAIRTYLRVVFYRYPSWREVASARLPLQQQGESITEAPGGGALWVGSEGENSAVIAVPLPDLRPDRPTTAPTSTAPTGGGAAVGDDANRELLKGRAVWVGAVAVTLLGMVLAILVARYVRHHRAS